MVIHCSVLRRDAFDSRAIGGGLFTQYANLFSMQRPNGRWTWEFQSNTRKPRYKIIVLDDDEDYITLDELKQLRQTKAVKVLAVKIALAGGVCG